MKSAVSHEKVIAMVQTPRPCSFVEDQDLAWCISKLRHDVVRAPAFLKDAIPPPSKSFRLSYACHCLKRKPSFQQEDILLETFLSLIKKLLALQEDVVLLPSKKDLLIQRGCWRKEFADPPEPIHHGRP